MKIAILGTGPSAAYVAMACDNSGILSDVISNRAPVNFFPGAFWPRLNPTKLEVSAKEVYISNIGDVLGYLKKQWKMIDSDWLKNTSFPKSSRTEIALNPYELFGQFWENKDVHLTIDITDLEIRRLAGIYDHVFMTFATEKSKKSRKEFLIRYPVISYPTDTMNAYCIYDGQENSAFVRSSCLFGYIHNEYSKFHVPSIEIAGEHGMINWVYDLFPDTPTWDPYDAPAENVTLVGRAALWDREVLSHHAYAQTLEVLEKM